MSGPTILQEDRIWYPSLYLDESMPVGRPSPNGWLCRLTDGAHAWGEHGDEACDLWPLQAVQEGEIVAFLCCDSLGSATVVVAEDGTFTANRTFSDDAFVWIHGDTEMSGDGVADLVRNMQSFDCHEGEHDIEACLWSNEHFFRFTAEGGPPRFEWVSSAGATANG